MNIFVTKLNYGTSSEALKELFEEFGEVSSAKVIIDKITGKSKGYGFVEMPDDSQGEKAINELNETEFENNVIIVKKARPKEHSNSGGGFNRNRY